MMETRVNLDNSSTLVNDSVKTYVFAVRKNAEEDDAMEKSKGNKFLQVFPSLCACLPCLVFGIMLGWLSPTLLYLLEENAEIPITWDQSASIAGFLMIGNLFGSTFSWIRPFGLKYGILVSTFPIVAGWLIVWQAFDVPCILAGRFLIGFGNGYVTPHTTEYINDTCEDPIRIIVSKFCYFFLMTGVVLAYCVGPFLTFRTFSLSVFAFSAIVMVVTLFIPHTPTELLKLNRVEQAEKRLKRLKPDVNIETVKSTMESQTKNELGLLDMVKNKYYLKTIPVLLILVVFQQFTGPPPIIVYSTVIFDRFGCQNPELFAIVYVFFYFISIMFASFYCHKFNMKYALVFTCFISSLLMFGNAYLSYFYPQPSWAYIKSLIMMVYIFVHSIGLGFLPSVMAPKFFEPNSLKSINRIQFGLHSICAIVSTKLFQVIITYHPFYLGFVYFSAIGAVGTLYIVIFIPREFKNPP